MIYSLRKKMIWICGSCVIGVFVLIYSVICVLGTRQLNANMDMLTDRISEAGGVFLPFDSENPRPPAMDRFPDFFTEETPFSTRFFAVWFQRDGQIVGENIESVSSITREDAREYAQAVQKKGAQRGWYGRFRYKLFDTGRGQAVVFVDGGMNRSTTQTVLLTVGAVLVGSMVVILILIILLSKRVVKPIAESYEKQKQFVTDANHELKTPLTLILTNLDIIESETGKSEWIDDIRIEGQRMGVLIHQLTALSRLDEEQVSAAFADFPFSDMVEDTVSEFVPLVEEKGLTITSCIQPGLTYYGDEGAIRRVVSILLDNAVKYCDPAGNIHLTLSAKRHPVLTVENDCRNVDAIELNRLFDRFYRADKARTAGTSFGIGLSLARAMVERHHGETAAYKAGEGRIGFRVALR